MAYLVSAAALLVGALTVFFVWNTYLLRHGYGGGSWFPAIPPRSAEAVRRWMPKQE